MAFWRRINQSKLQFISNQYRRFYFQAPFASSLHQTRISLFEKPICSFDNRPSYFYSNVRYFAAPVQAIKNKKVEPSKDRPRLNKQITASVVRLVFEDGHHSIVSIDEALEQARKNDLDLVEVQKQDNPPVCRLMDFHKERYQRRLREKERAKSKAGETVKRAGCKKVRFTEKIEEKDLKIKAESVIRLLERGYLVKCIAMGHGKEDEEEDLGGLLSHLTDLIKDVSVVESGPRVEKRQAFVIVKHVKFGPSKKGGGKTLSKVIGGNKTEPSTDSDTDRQRSELPQDDDSLESGLESEFSDEDDLPTSSPMQMLDENVDDEKTVWSVSESGEDFDKLFDRNGVVSSNSARKEIRVTQQRASSSLNDYKSKFLHPKQDVTSTASNTSQYPCPETSLGIDNRYKRSEQRNPFPPAKPMEHMGQGTRVSVRSEPQFPYQRQEPPQNMGQSRSEPQFRYPRQQPHQNMGQNMRESVRSEPQFSYQRRQLPQNISAASSVQDTKQVEKDLKQQPSHPGTPASSFGIFSNPKANSSGKQGAAADAHGSSVGNRYASVRNRGMEGNAANQNLPGSQFDGSRKLDSDLCGQDRFGIFSRDNANMTPNRMPKSN